MAINLQKTLDNIRKKQGTYVPSTGKGDKIDLNKTLENIRAKSAAELEQRQAQMASDKLKARKMATSPLSARAAETLAGLQEGTAQPKLHPTGGPLKVSQDTLRDLGMVNENGFVLGGVDPADLGLDAEDMAALLKVPQTKPQEVKRWEPAAEKDKIEFKDYLGYLAGEFGAGMLSSPSGIMGGATTAIGDLATGGQVSAGAQTLANYFAQKPQMMQRWMTNEIGVEQMIQNETGVSAAALAAYRAANTDDWLRKSLQEDRGHNLEDWYKENIGQGAYTIGQQVPGMIYSMGAPATDGGGILSSVASAIKNKSGVGQALASSAKGALKGNVNTWLMGAGAAGNQLTELAKQKGFDPQNYINAMGNGFVEYITEGMLGFSDAPSVAAIWRNTGSKGSNALKAIVKWLQSSAEEGLEEVINVPMSGIVDKMTVERDKKLVGEGGIFDLKEMLRSGIAGAAVGMIMGGVGGVSSIRNAVLEGASIFDAATATNHLIDTMPKDMRPAHIDPKTATAETLEQKQAEVLDALEHMVDTATVNAFEQGAEQTVQSDAQAAPQMQTEAVQSNEQSVDIKQEALNNEQTEILSGRGPQRGSAPIDAGSAGQVERAGTAAAARRNQQQIAQRRTSVAEQNGLRRVSSRELGLDTGTDLRRNVVLEDESLWDDELRSIKKNWDDMNRRRREKYGYTQDMELKFVLGKMQVRDANGTDVLVDGVVNDDGSVCVCVNSMTRSATEIAEHEFFHTLEAETPDLVDALWPAVESVGLNDAMVQRYRRFYSETLGYSERMVRAEILADAYAGLERIQGTEMQTVKDMVRQLTGEAQEAIERGWYTPAAEETYESVDGEGRETRGPPMYSVVETEDGRMVAVVDSDILANIDTSNWTDEVKAEAKSAAKAALLQFTDGVKVNETEYRVNRTSRREYTRSKYTERLYKKDKTAFADKMRAAANTGDVITATTNWARDGELKHPRTDNFVDFTHGDVLIQAGENKYDAETVVGITAAGEFVFYDVVDMNPTEFTTKEGLSTTAFGDKSVGDIQESPSGNSVPQGASVVKARFSVSDEVDSKGNELSVEQAEYFADSKVRDENGDLMVMYHGTPNAGFTVFRSGTYFTPNREYADVYQSPGASSISVKRGADNPDTYAAYLNITKPFDTRNEAEREIFENEFYRQWGTGTPLADSGLPDWVDGMDLQEFIEEMGYDYDGLILDEGGTGGYGEEVRSRGLSYVVFSPEQVKNIDNRTPTSNPDIRYSVADEQETTERPRRDLTPGQELTRKEHTLIKRAINQSKMQLRDIVPAGTKKAREVQQMQILDLAQKLWETGEITQENIDDAFEEIWLKGAMVDRELADQYAELRAALRTGVSVSEDLKKDITDYGQFRRANFGSFTMRSGQQSDVDIVYQELSGQYPSFFPENITEPSDQLQQMADVAQRLKPVVRTVSEQYKGDVDAKAGMKADFVDLVRSMELEILHPVQEITKKQKDQKEAERVASYRQIYKEVMDEVFKVQQRETYEPDPEYWHEVADDAWNRMNERAEAIQGEWLRSLTKEGFKGTESLDELGVKIAGSVADYHLIDQILENHRAAQSVRKDIRKAERKLKATSKEKNYAAGIASGVFTEADISGDARPHVVLELADYYMMERIVGLDLIEARRNDMYAEVDYQVESLMQDKDAYKVSSSPVLFYRTPQRNMINMYGREHGQKVYDFLFAPVAENEAERIRWVNRMHDEVGLVEGENGKKKPLNRKERALVQMVMEGRAVAEVVAAMEEREVIYDAAANLRNEQDIEDIVRQFNLNREMRNVVVDYATWLDTNDLLQTTKGVDQKRINNAVELYAKQYNQFYKAINDFLAAHGYEPIGFIKGYAPHIQPEATRNLLQSTLKMMGLSEGVTELPAAIAGRTHVYRPNKRWNPYFMSRHGDQTEYDVTAGYESYVDYLSDILYHTDDTVRIRRAANYFRRTYAPEEISNNLSWAEGLRNASPEQKAEMLREQNKLKYTETPSAAAIGELFDKYVDELYDSIKDQSKYSNFVNWLEDYANQLTGKQSLADRGMEVFAGRQSLNFANKLNRAFQRANVAGNLSTALNQTAQLPMIVADIGNFNTLLALKDYAVGKVRRDGFKEKSDFLTARKGMNNLVVDPTDRVINIMFTPAQVADDLVSTIAARGAYIKAVRQGMSAAEAMRYADRKAEQIMGSRAKGSAPQAFRSKNPLWRMVNMFQIEALNAFEYVEQDLIIQGIKDIKQIDDSKGRATATAALIGLLGKMLVAAFLWNRTTEELYGGSPAQFDLLGYAANFIASGNGLTANQQLLDWIDTAWERAFGEPLFDIDPDYNEEFDWANASDDLAYAIGSDIPLVRNLAGLFGVGDQSLPMPDLSTIGDVAEKLKSTGASAETLDAALAAAGQFLPGGRQINKTYQGARTMAKGGRYYGYGENQRLQYPVENSAGNWVKALLFGPSGLSENTEFYAAGGDDGLSAGNTRKYQELMQVGMTSEMALETYEEYRRINRLEDLTASEKATEFAKWLADMEVPAEQAKLAREAFMFWGMVPGEATKYDTFVGEGLEADDAYALTEALGALEPEEGETTVSNLQRYRAVLDHTTDEAVRYAALAGVMQAKEFARLRAAYDYVQSGTYVEFLTAFDEAYPGETKSQERVETVLRQMRLDAEERAALWQMCGPKWKTDNNPFSKSVGREVAGLIEEYYAEINGE